MLKSITVAFLLLFVQIIAVVSAFYATTMGIGWYAGTSRFNVCADPRVGQASNSIKRQQEAPGLKPSICRVFCFNPECFWSFNQYAMRLYVEPLFLATLHRAISTVAVKNFDSRFDPFDSACAKFCLCNRIINKHGSYRRLQAFQPLPKPVLASS